MAGADVRKERLDRGIKVRTSGIYAISGGKEIGYLILPRLVLIVGLLLLPLVVTNPYWQRVISIVGIYALLALSFDFLTHYVGLVSLGGAFFVGVGGYLAALLNTKLGLSPLFSIPLATVGGASSARWPSCPACPCGGSIFPSSPSCIPCWPCGSSRP